MERVQFLAFTAQLKGATGVREYLQEHRQVAPAILQELSGPVLLNDGEDAEGEAAPDFGIRMEQLPLIVQREIWSALVSGASPSGDVAEQLARAFLRVAVKPRRRETDTVCMSLAKMVLRDEACEEQKTTMDAAFRRRMRRLTLNRVMFPSQEDEDDEVYKSLPTGGRSDILQTARANSYRGNKRSRGETPEDLDREQSSKNRSPALEAGATAPERPPLTKEMEERASGVAKQLVLLSRSEATAAVDDVATRAFDMLAEVVNDVHTTYAANERSFQYLCKMLRVDSTSDEALLQITRNVSIPMLSALSIFLETSVLPKIRAADSVISRVLLQTALRFGSSYAGTLVDSLLLPLLVGGECDAVGPPQAEAITRILRSLDTVPADQLDGFLLKSLEAVTANDNLHPHLLSNESALLVFQNVLNTKPVLSVLTIERLVGACEAVLERPEAEQVRGSLKFATVIFTLISKYPQQCSGHVETLEAIATQLTSIMAKTTLRSLQKLKTSK
ncbi:hypothetical protein GN244_ATG18780 [Phytophthora infestans]|uniref:Fanconi Anaemia group E protein C-terminal domain-containing protein n=1 Tax=Phytophthora infestans TaxID=4787 RepID=A0A833WJN1_PHYIN|nr:hypothetical protein GN244_ATG18780 [Phytophthora infestans]